MSEYNEVKDHSRAILGLKVASCICLSVATVFFFVGPASYSNTSVNQRRASWFVYDDIDDVVLFIGLKKLLIDSTAGGVDTSVDQRWSSSSCVADYCKKCQQDGDATFGLVVGALILAFISLVVQLIGFTCPPTSTVSSGISLFTSFLAGICSLIGFTLFVSGPCYREITDLAAGIRLEYGNGAILTLFGMLLTMISVIFTITVMALAAEQGKPLDQEEPAQNKSKSHPQSSNSSSSTLPPAKATVVDDSV